MVLKLVPKEFLNGQRSLQHALRTGVQLLATIAVIAAANMQSTAFAVVPQFRIVVSDARGAAIPDAAVMLLPTEISGKAAPTVRPRLSVPAMPVVIQQLDRECVPRITLVAVGSRLSLPNNDAVPHSVYSFSPAKQFEFEVYVGSSPQVLTLDKPGVITLGCNIHDWMVGYIVVVDTPFAQTTDARGAVSLKNVPEGDYQLRVWHSQQRVGEHVAQLSATTASLPHAVVIDLAPPRTRYKPPVTLKRYE